MRLAEALIERAELQKKNAQLINRINDNTLVQEGDEPAESPEKLIKEYDDNMRRLQWLIQRINETNSKTFLDEQITVVDAIARRDCLGLQIHAYREFYNSAKIKPDRYNKREIKFVRCIDAKSIRNSINDFSKEYRELDTRLQGFNWTVDLIEGDRQ